MRTRHYYITEDGYCTTPDAAAFLLVIYEDLSAPTLSRKNVSRSWFFVRLGS